MPALPIDGVLGSISSSLRRNPCLVLIAPPGAGKTTAVPPMLLDEGLAADQIWVLQPRRIAARLAAVRVSEQRQTRVGGEVGYRVRFENRTSSSTRIVYVTEGILTQRLVRDPFLEGVSAVILDEFHERSIHADLALAMLKEVQEVRPDLKLVVMSATLDPGPVAEYLNSCPIVQSEGRAYPVRLRYLERVDERSAEARVLSAVKRALREPEASGDILVFLPGVGAIHRLYTSLSADLLEVATVHKLYGEMGASAQDEVVKPRPQGALRRIILSTNVAESALTIPDVDIVVDSGLAKVARYDSSRAIDYLEIHKISKFSADQRAGRAGRIRSGLAFRVWTEAEQKQLRVAEAPEITRLDLTGPVLDVCLWAGKDPQQFGWFESPKAGQLSAAVKFLRQLGALPEHGFRPTLLGEVLAKLPIHPRLGKVLLFAKALGFGREGARLAALLAERDILRERETLRDKVSSSDLIERLERLEAVSTGIEPRQLGLDHQGTLSVLRVAQRLEEAVKKAPPIDVPHVNSEEEALLRSILSGFPDRIARREDGLLRLVGGGRALLVEDSVVKDSDFLVAIQMDGHNVAGSKSRVRLASRIEKAWLETVSPYIKEETIVRYSRAKERIEAVRIEGFGGLELSSTPVPLGDLDPSAALEEAVSADLDRFLPITDELFRFFCRYAFLARTKPELKLPELGAAQRAELVPEIVCGKRSLAEVLKTNLVPYFLARAPEAQQWLDTFAPESLEVPSGRKVRLKYPAEGPPVLSVRLQEVFGLYKTPKVGGGKVAVKMELLAPNQRPVQVTQDLESFWAHTYADVRKELRRRYPKHQWPENPADGIPSRHVRPRAGGGRA